MKAKILLPVLLFLSLSGCTSANEESKDVYLTFTSTKLNTNIYSESDITCTLYDDNTAVFSSDESTSYTWKDNNNKGLILTSDGLVLYMDYYSTSATHYFFYQKDDTCYRFEAKDTSYYSTAVKNGTPHYEEMAEVVFAGSGSTSGQSSIGTISLLSDENKTVYYASQGMNGIETNYLTLGNNWSLKDNVYTFEMNGISYQSSYSQENGYSFTIGDYQYTYLPQ